MLLSTHAHCYFSTYSPRRVTHVCCYSLTLKGPWEEKDQKFKGHLTILKQLQSRPACPESSAFERFFWGYGTTVMWLILVNKLGIAGFRSRPVLLSELLFVPCAQGYCHAVVFHGFFSPTWTAILSANQNGSLLWRFVRFPGSNHNYTFRISETQPYDIFIWWCHLRLIWWRKKRGFSLHGGHLFYLDQNFLSCF